MKGERRERGCTAPPGNKYHCAYLSIYCSRSNPSLIPDGTYSAHVERIINPRQIEVTMQSTLTVFLSSGRPNVTFSDKLKPNDDITVTLTNGQVVAFGKKRNNRA